MISRRLLLSCLPSCTLAMPALAAAGFGEELYRDVVRYADLGPKRTGSDADHAVSDWLEHEARKLGAQVDRQPYGLSQFVLDECSVTVAERRVSSFPLWFPVASSGPIEGVPARLGGAAQNSIAVELLGDGIGGLRQMPSLVRAAAERKCSALLLVTQTPSGLPFAHGLGGRLPVPTVIVGSKEWPALQAAIENRSLVRVTLRGTEKQKQSQNIIARFGAPGRPIIGVSTPTTAWLSAGGERGGGVAMWLALMRRAAMRPGKCSYVFAAVSGHELDAMGGRKFAASAYAPDPKETLVWCHLGAAIGAREVVFPPGGSPQLKDKISRQTRIIASDSKVAEQIRRIQINGPYNTVEATSYPPRGEMKLYVDGGYRAFGYEGSNAYFHTEGDSQASTTPDILEIVYLSLVKTIEYFEGVGYEA